MVEVIKLAIQLAVLSTGVFYIMLFNLPKILTNTATALLVLGVGALSLPAAQAQQLPTQNQATWERYFFPPNGNINWPNSNPTSGTSTLKEVLQECQGTRCVIGDERGTPLKKKQVKKLSGQRMRLVTSRRGLHLIQPTIQRKKK